MTTGSRGVRDAIVRGLAWAGLAWALAVLGALFMAMSAQGLHDDALAGAVPSDHDASFSVTEPHAPSTAGLALALVVLGGGLTVLAVGARGDHRPEPRRAPGPQPLTDVARFLGLLS